MDSVRDHLTVGFPHSDIHGSKPALGSPWLFAECHVLHRLSVPRHPRNALMTLDRALRRDKPDASHLLEINSEVTTGATRSEEPGAPPDQEKPIHDDKEPVSTGNVGLRRCRRQGSVHFHTNEGFKRATGHQVLVEPVGIEPTTSSLQS
jgi:hypothetical protein